MSSSTILVTTPTGNTGRYVVQTLLDAQPQSLIRIFVRDPEKLALSVRSRCEVIPGDLRNPADLARALAGIESAFFCVPQSPDPENIPAYYRSFAEPFADAAKTAGLKRVVTISGGDEQETRFSGVGEGLHLLEQIINDTGIAATHIRCGYFMENFQYLIHGIARAGIFSLPVADDVPIPFVAARDIGAGAARLLLDPTWTYTQFIAAHGPVKLSCPTAAAIAAEVLDSPVRFQSVNGADYEQNLARFGVSSAMSRSLVGMFAAITAGRDMGAPASRYLDCPTTLYDWMTTELRPALAQLRTETNA